MNKDKDKALIRLSISNIGWDQRDDEMMYEYLQEMNIHGIEIAPTRLWPENPYDKLREAEHYKEQMKQKHGLSISSIQSIWYGVNQKLFGLAQEREELLQYTKKAILFAQALGCANLVFGCPKSRNIEMDEQGQYNKDQSAIGIEFFHELGEFAYAHNTCLSIEANPTVYHTNYINTTKDAIELAKAVNSKGFRVNGDMGTIIYNKEELSDLAGQVGMFNHFHISEPELNPIKDRIVNNELVHLLIKEGYRGYLSVEMKRVNHDQYLEDIKRAITYLSSLVQ